MQARFRDWGSEAQQKRGPTRQQKQRCCKFCSFVRRCGASSKSSHYETEARGSPQVRGYCVGDSYNKDYSSLGSIIGSKRRR